MATDAIIDSSVIVALLTPEKHLEWASNKMRKYASFHALDLSFYGVANAIQHKVSDGFDSNDATASFKRAEEMMNLFTVHNFSEVIIDSLTKALEQKIAVYNAAFLSLADKPKIPLLTLDMKLAKNLEHTKYDEFVEYPNKPSHK